jgi:hypothetical protein
MAEPDLARNKQANRPPNLGLGEREVIALAATLGLEALRFRLDDESIHPGSLWEPIDSTGR